MVTEMYVTVLHLSKTRCLIWLGTKVRDIERSLHNGCGMNKGLHKVINCKSYIFTLLDR